MIKEPIQFTFDAIGTVWVIDVFEKQKKSTESNLLPQIKSLISDFDSMYSRFRKDSWLLNIGKKQGAYELPFDGAQILQLYEKLYTITDGLFTPLIGIALESAGYDNKYSLKQTKVLQTPSWKDVMVLSQKKLWIKQPVIIDFGAIGKGYLIDRVGELLLKNNVRDFCVDAGGDIYMQRKMDVVIGLEDPNDFSKVIGTISMRQGSVCGSSGNRRKWQEFHHILNPKTGVSPHNILATWVRADTAMLADGLSTCLFLVSPEKLMKHFNFEYLILHEDYSVTYSARFGAELF